MALTERQQEHREIIKALHQWLSSQGVEQRDWGPILAKAAGYEVWRIGRGKPISAVGLMIAVEFISQWAMEDRLNV